MLLASPVGLGKPTVLVLGGRLGMGRSVSNLLLVTRDLRLVGKDARLVREEDRLGLLQEGQGLHVLLPPAVVLLCLVEVVPVGGFVGFLGIIHGRRGGVVFARGRSANLRGEVCDSIAKKERQEFSGPVQEERLRSPKFPRAPTPLPTPTP